MNVHTIHPWILNFCNNVTNDDQIRAAEFPDINTASLSANSRFSMSAGDFLQIYDEPSLFYSYRNCHRITFLFLDDWDCVTTCFFLDTAHNIIEYVERLWKILKPGGVWINFGLCFCFFFVGEELFLWFI
jgi:carnosine N-methyltransferase